MKILMLNYEYPPLGGGAAPVTQSLSEELVLQGHEVDVVTMGYNDLPHEEIINGVHIYRVPCLRKRVEVCTFSEMLSFCISAYRFLPELLEKKQYDINHTHFIIPTGLVSSFFYKRLPFIITSHGSDVPGYNPDRFKLHHLLLKPFSAIIIDRACSLTTPSQYLKGEIEKNYGGQNVTVIPYGIYDKISPDKPKKRKILTVSRFFERKGIQYVIEAMKYINDFEYVICGDGPYRMELEKQIEKLNVGDRVRITGFLKGDELREEYESAAIFILPSVADNFPVVLMEAMSAGCAVITSNTTGCAEVVGETGLLVPPEDTDAIRAQLIKLIEDRDLCRKLGIMARKRVEQEFTWDPVARKYVSLYKKVLERESANKKPLPT